MPPRRAAAAAAATKRRYLESGTDSDPGGESSGSQSAYTEGSAGEEEPEAESTPQTEEEEEITPPPAKRKRVGGGAKAAPRPRGSTVSMRSHSSLTATPVAKVKAGNSTSARPSGKATTAAGPKGKHVVDEEGQDDDSGLTDEEEDGVGGSILQVTRLAPAPSQKHQAGRVGGPLMDFLAHLANPVYNDREWFHAHEKVWKWVKLDWDLFVSDFLEALMDVDETVPYLPAKDMVYRIHRDVRFSNDKTPYKKAVVATFSRGGRKGAYAGYHLVVKANDLSGIHAGFWDPPAPLLNVIREHIKNDTPEFRQLKEIISRKDFVELFGSPEPNPKKGIQGSLWGSRDLLKTAPKGVDKSHAEIHFLRLKSIFISKHFTDLEVTNQDPQKPGDFKVKCIEAARVAKDFVEVLNEMMYPTTE